MSHTSCPWQYLPLCDWSICGMNHYHVKGERFLFISMVKNGRCITVEGKDDEHLWQNLRDIAIKIKSL